MIVPQQLAEAVQLLLPGGHRRRPQRLQQAAVVPEILHALAPLVEALHRRAPARLAELAAAPAVHGQHPAAEAAPPGVVHGPVVDAAPGLAQRLGAGVEDGSPLAGLVGPAPAAGQLLPEGVEVPGLAVEAAHHLVQGAREDGGVAQAGQAPGGVAVGLVLAPVDVAAEVGAHEPHQAAQALHRLARLVHVAVAVVGALGETVDGLVELLAGDPPHPVGDGFSRVQTEGHGEVEGTGALSECPAGRACRPGALPRSRRRVAASPARSAPAAGRRRRPGSSSAPRP